jgi:hypothetical protein
MNTLKGLVCIILLLCAGSLNAQNDNSLIGKARAELNSCIARAHANGFDVFVSTQEEGTCPDGDGTTTVFFIGTVHCPPHEPCPQIAVSVGYVQFDCEGNIIASQCNIQ